MAWAGAAYSGAAGAVLKTAMSQGPPKGKREPQHPGGGGGSYR